jgi:acid phosphatase family membrane protein YuiD
VGDIIHSPYIIAALSGWIVAQGSKYITVAIKDKSLNRLRQLYLSGQMPSSHSATTVAVATVVGYRDGFSSAIFGVAALVACIVMYDAMMVRRSSGEQGVAIQELIKEQKSNVAIPRAARGHTPAEVAVGAILGAIIGYVVFLATK